MHQRIPFSELIPWYENTEAHRYEFKRKTGICYMTLDRWVTLGIPHHKIMYVRHRVAGANDVQMNRFIILGDREKEVIKDFKSGLPLEATGRKHKVTRERVRQILRLHGISSGDGGASLMSFCNASAGLRAKSEKEKKRRLQIEAIFKCGFDEFVHLNGSDKLWSDKKCRALKYYNQKRNADRRGIGWEITFPEWCRAWDDSGKWELRGRGQGYCMGRIGDTGPYSADNVYICTIGQNFSDSYYKHSWHKRFKKAA